MKRLRLYDLRLSRLPRVLGICADDVSVVAEKVNTAQQRLLYAPEAHDESWWGTWAEVLFNVDRDNPYITLPRDMARLESVNVCNEPVSINNQFYEYLRFGNGRMPKQCNSSNLGITDLFERNNAVTFTDLSDAPQYIRAYITEESDINKRIFFQGTDSNGNTVYTQSGLNRVDGEFVTLVSPFATTTIPYNSLTGIQKDQTAGRVLIYQVDPDTAAEVLLSVMEPGEETAQYRRYYLHNLPKSCCFTSATDCTIQVRAIVKRELIPVKVDTDYTLIQNMEAIIEEAQAVRYSEVDNQESKSMEMQKHESAIRFLNGELSHYIGADNVAINVKVFGSARLEKQKIGSIL